MAVAPAPVLRGDAQEATATRAFFDAVARRDRDGALRYGSTQAYQQSTDVFFPSSGSGLRPSDFRFIECAFAREVVCQWVGPRGLFLVMAQRGEPQDPARWLVTGARTFDPP